MSSKRSFLLAAVGVTLAAPSVALAGGDRCANAAADAEATQPAEPEVLVAAIAPEELPREAFAEEFWPADLSSCEVTVANTKGPSYDAACVERLNTH